MVRDKFKPDRVEGNDELVRAVYREIRSTEPAGLRCSGPTNAALFGLRERRRLERDLHDGAQQRLVSLALTLRLAREKLDVDAEPGEAGRLLDRSRAELDQAAGQGLRPEEQRGPNIPPVS
jgi:signal transduction histidine kinase